MSSDWIVVALITGLLVIMTGFSVFLAFQSGRDDEPDDRADESSEAGAKPGPETGRQAA